MSDQIWKFPIKFYFGGTFFRTNFELTFWLCKLTILQHYIFRVLNLIFKKSVVYFCSPFWNVSVNIDSKNVLGIKGPAVFGYFPHNRDHMFVIFMFVSEPETWQKSPAQKRCLTKQPTDISIFHISILITARANQVRPAQLYVPFVSNFLAHTHIS
jgi:hypothetical protein